MESLLDIFKTKIHKSGDTITVLYYNQNDLLGKCVYKRKEMVGMIKKLRRVVYILDHVDMDNTIEELYKRGDITSAQDIKKINLQIKTHSRNILEKNNPPM